MGQQLSPGVQHRQRRPQLVGGVGDESSLQRQRLRQWAHRPLGEQHHDGDRGQDAGQLGESERHQQPVAGRLVGSEFGHGHHPTLGPVRHQHPITPALGADLGEPGRTVEQRHARLTAVTGGDPPVALAQRQFHVRRRIVGVVRGFGQALQPGADLAVLRPRVHGEHHPADDEQHQGQRQRRLNGGHPPRPLHDGEIAGRRRRDRLLPVPPVHSSPNR